MTPPARAGLLTPLLTAGPVEAALSRVLRQEVARAGAAAGALVFRPSRGAPIVVTAGARSATRALLDATSAKARTLRVPLTANGRSVGHLVLLGRSRAPRRAALPAGLGRDLGAAIDGAWRRERRALRTTVLSEITRLLGSSDSLDDVLSAFAEGLARLVDFDSVAVSLVDAERSEFEVLDVTARTVPSRIARDVRLPLEGTLLERVVASGEPARVDDLAAAAVPAASRATLGARGWRSVVVVPLVTQGGVFGAVSLASARTAAFDEADVESAAELAQPLASAIEQRRLLDEGRRRAEEL
ncbi:MAG TPA: GAF domain-containing protein, partial [Methylomirabilota bacterium]|nr:GAF domain-containing protein [Methylomirabilota bacterium]